MNIKNYWQLALITFRRTRLRTFLTSLGIIIGIAAVIIIIAAGQGLRGYIISQLDSFGSNILQLETRIPSLGKNSAEEATARAFGTVVTTLKLSDMLAIRKLPNIKNNYAAQIGQAVATSLNAKKTVNIYGISPTFFEIDNSKVAIGRQFTEEDDASLARVVILGSEVATDFFGDANPVGQNIKIKQNNFQVIGVMASRGSSFGFNFDVFVYMPVQTLMKQVMGIDYISAVTNQYIDKEKVASTIADIEDLMRIRHHLDTGDPNKDDFIVHTMDEVISILDTVLGAFTLLLIALAAISLIVGGVGITNIMYVSVLERTFEIGLRKAVGATRKQILRQFLMEAVLVTSFGGVVGVVLGFLVSYLIAVIAQSQGVAWTFVVPIYSIILGVGFAFVCGLVFGIYPARKAATLDPIDALRHE